MQRIPDKSLFRGLEFELAFQVPFQIIQRVEFIVSEFERGRMIRGTSDTEAWRGKALVPWFLGTLFHSFFGSLFTSFLALFQSCLFDSLLTRLVCQVLFV